MDTPRIPSRYRLRYLLGQGGQGQVFRVHDSLLDAEVALKVAPSDLSDWLRHEFETLRHIQHENIVRVFDWGFTDSGEVFYTMELVLGGDWGGFMGGPQTPEETTRILTGLLRGLAHLHSHREIHGDLKPGNVLIGADGSIKLTDVGMGNAITGDLLSGTPGYAAPELWRGGRSNIRSDIYSIGVMAYEALTGRHPFLGKTIRQVVSEQLEGWVPSPRAHGIRLPAGLEREIMRAMDRDPALRPASADEFLEGIGDSQRTVGILGGRFVARTVELGDFDALLESEDPATPTLVWIQGDGGIGKSAFIDEVSARAIGRGVRIDEFSDLREVALLKTPFNPTFAESESLWMKSESNPTVFLSDAPTDTPPAMLDALRTLARHLHVLALERGQRSPVMFVCEAHQEQGVMGDFERAFTLTPFTDHEVGSFLGGYLGTVTVQPEVVRWLTSTTGGLPGRLAATIDQLITQGFLRRNQGHWRFAESGAFPSIERSLHRGRWSKSLERLSTRELALVTIVATLPQGLPSDLLASVSGEKDLTDVLLTKGWLRNVGGRILPASGEIRRVALEGNSRDHTAAVERVLLDQYSSRLTREERGWLLLRNRTTSEALEEGLWSARRARERGDLLAAVERARRCVELAGHVGDVPRGEEAGLIAAQALHLLGEYEEAAAQLPKSRSPAVEQLLGLIQRSRGNLDAARKHLSTAVALSQENGSTTIFLQSNAELAEVEWRHGDQKARDTAIIRLKGALAHVRQEGNVDDRAALIYQLGAALVTTGRRDEGKQVLEQGLALSPSDYWRMRIANALGAGEYYLGNFERALEWMDEAWSMAERGGFDSFKARIFSGRAGVHYGLGKFRDAVEYHRLSSMWATRSGERFEYMAACSGEAAGQMQLGEYEQALKCAREAYRIAGAIGNEFEEVKNLETEGACLFLIGDYANAELIAGRVLNESQEYGKSAVAPRALLLAGTLARVNGRWQEAVAMLEEAEKSLQESRDWEDLPIVQVELQGIRAREDAAGAAKRVAEIVAQAARSGALTVELRGCVVLGEILLEGRLDHRKHWDALMAGLSSAGEAGASEEEWRLHYILAELSLRDGDRKGAATRLAQAVRVFRLIADRLSPEHRSCYLRTQHARNLLSRAS